MINLLRDDEIFKIHLTSVIEHIFDFFPDVYTFNFRVQHKFKRIQLDIAPKIYIDPIKNLMLLNELRHNSDLFFNWKDLPSTRIISVEQDACNYIEFIEYVIIRLSEQDEIKDYLKSAHQTDENYSSFRRVSIEADKKFYLGEEIEKKQEKMMFDSIISPALHISKVSKL